MTIFRTKIRSLKFKFSSKFLTIDGIIFFVGILVAVAWIWGSISAMEKNYALQQELDKKRRDKIIAEIQHDTLFYEQKYLQSREYKELAVREKLGLATEGESVLILPDYPKEEVRDKKETKKDSNFSQWMNFLFGGNKSTKK